MSGIVGSRFNHKGSGLVGSLGTDGQVFTSAGAGKSAVYEDAAGGAWTLIQTLTSDGSDTTMNFTSGLDSTYDEYCFRFINIHPETDNGTFQFNGSIDGGSNYNVAKHTTSITAYHQGTDGSGTSLAYEGGSDVAAYGTGHQVISREIGADADQSTTGWLYLFAPSDTTFLKYFIGQSAHKAYHNYIRNPHHSGFFNTTSAINAIQFNCAADDIQAGKIKLYGIS